ncbi:MAG: S1 RNA-binding domain-containing protein [Anaerolineales bacterium]|nr:S1 RNA-binding domain-containing protein [Anaerolineales bacterium]
MSDKEKQTPGQTLSSIKPGQKIKGTISKVELFGAFVDVGLDHPGLVHISQLKRGRVNRVQDIVKEGDEVEVWVQKVDPASNRLELTMIKPVEVKWNDLKPGTTYPGQVMRIENFGVFVDIGAERHGLVHVSEMRDDYVRDPAELVSVGDTIDVKVLEIDRKKRQIRLSMKESPEEILEDVEPEEAIPTAMEIALRQALDENEPPAETPKPADVKSSKKHSKELEDILSRTLQRKVSTSKD